jgi:transposase
MRNFKLNPNELFRLRKAHRNAKEKWAADRIKAIVLLGSGWTLELTAEALMVDIETLRNWIERYREGGTKRLLERDYLGREGELDEEQQQELKVHLQDNTYMTVKAIRAHIHKQYGVKYSRSGATALLHRLGFVYKKPKIHPGKIDAVAQIKFLEKYDKIRRSGEPVYFVDGCHPQHNSQPNFGWILKGHNKLLLSNTGRKRVNIHGGININTHKLVSIVDDKNIDADTFILLLEAIQKRHGKGEKVHIILDNAGYHKGDKVAEFLKKNKKLKLTFLPPYCPHLNLIERVWKHFKNSVLYNRYYPVFSEFKQACVNFLKTDHRKKFATLLTEKFHLVEKNWSMLTPNFGMA